MSALTVLIAGKLWLKHRPVAFLVVVGGIVAARLLDLEAQGVALLGDVPQGLPSLGLPASAGASSTSSCRSRSRASSSRPWRRPLSAGCSPRSTATGSTPTTSSWRSAPRISLAGLGRGFPVSGGMSQSLVNESAGARTPLSGLIAAVFMLIVALFASGLLRNLPQPVLAAIVLTAVMSLVDVAHCGTSGGSAGRSSSSRWRRCSACWDPARSTASCSAPPSRSSSCSGRPPGRASPSWPASPARRASPIGCATRRTSTSGVFVVRCEAALLYFNVEYVRDRLFELLAGAGSGAARRLLPWRVPRSTSQAPTARRSAPDLLARGVAFRVADVHGEVRGALRRIGFEREYGPLESGQTVDAVLSQWQARV